jgi:hypothetical protein
VGIQSDINERILNMEEGPIAQFWSHGRDLQEEAKFTSALNQLLKEFRKTLDDSSPLAKSIDSGDPSETMAILADQGKYPQLAEILFLDTLEGDKRKEERRLALGRRQEGRRKASLEINPDKREVPRRSNTRRDSVNERRAT